MSNYAKSKDFFLWSNEQLDGQEIFRIYTEINKAFANQDLKQYYFNVRCLLNQAGSHMKNKKVENKIRTELNQLIDVIYLSKPLISQEMPNYLKKLKDAYIKIETLQIEIRDCLDQNGFFKKTFSTPSHSLAVPTQ